MNIRLFYSSFHALSQCLTSLFAIEFRAEESPNHGVDTHAPFWKAGCNNLCTWLDNAVLVNLEKETGVLKKI